MHIIDGDPACMCVGLKCHEYSKLHQVVALSLIYGLQQHLAWTVTTCGVHTSVPAFQYEFICFNLAVAKCAL